MTTHALAAGPSITNPSSSFDAAINHVVFAGAEEEMGWIAAGRVVASVTNEQTRRNGSVGEGPCNAMRKPLAIECGSTSETSIPVGKMPSLPRPTGIGSATTVNRRPELFHDLRQCVAFDEPLLASDAMLHQTAVSAIGAVTRKKSGSGQIAVTPFASDHRSDLGVVARHVGDRKPAHMTNVVACALGQRSFLPAAAQASVAHLSANLGTHFRNLHNRFGGCRARGDSSRARVFACLNYTPLRHEMAVLA